MGNLFFRKQSIEVIKNLRYADMKEWNEWHELMADKESKVKCSKCGKEYDLRKQKKCTCGGS